MPRHLLTCGRLAGSLALFALFAGCAGGPDPKDDNGRPGAAANRVFGKIHVIGSYPATPTQVAEASQAGSFALVDHALKPARDALLAKAKDDYRKRMDALDYKYAKKLERAGARGGRVEVQTAHGEERAQITAQFRAMEAALEHGFVEAALAATQGRWRPPFVSSYPDTLSAADVRSAAAKIEGGAAKEMERYLAVGVSGTGQPAENTPGAASVILWDTRAGSPASHDTFVLDRRPVPGQRVRVGGRTAPFLGG